MKKLLTLIILTLLAAVQLYAQDGSLDAAFGDGGIVEIDYGMTGDQANDVAIQADGKIVVAGYRKYSNYNYMLARYNSDGSLDETFGIDGKIVKDVFNSGFGSNAASIALQSDGKILAAGWADNGGGYSCSILRYNSDGSLDSGFDYDGIVYLETTNRYSDENFSSVTVDTDQKIVVVGHTASLESETDIKYALIARYNSDGSLDTGFNSVGYSKAELPGHGDWDYFRAVDVQTDGQIIAGGYDYGSVDSHKDFLLVKYHTDGSLNTGFGGDGVVNQDFGSTNEVLNDLKIQDDGKVVAVGYMDNDLIIARFNTNGSLDTGFGTSGYTTVDIDGADRASAVEILADGSFIVFGYTSDDFVVLKFTPSGILDSGFGSGGYTTTDIHGFDYGRGMAVQSDGKIVGAGSSNDDIALVRYDASGTLDTGFDADGIVLTDIGLVYDVNNAVVALGDGKTINGGVAAGKAALMYLNADGSPDTDCSEDGKVWDGFTNDDRSEFNALKIQPDGRLLAAGSKLHNTNYDYDFITARYNEDGSKHTRIPGQTEGFNTTTGYLVTDFGGNDDKAYAVSIDHNLRPIAAGYSYSGSNNDFALVRYTVDGLLDTGFDGDGLFTYDFAGGDDQCRALAVLDDNQILMAGYARNGSNDDFALLMVDSVGNVVKSFGNSGMVLSDFNGNTDRIYDILLQPDGKILAGGYVRNSNYDFAVARYNSDGSLDETFGESGFVGVDIAGGYDYGQALALQADGKFILGGYAQNGSYDEFAMVRFNPNGSLDNTFGVNGIVTTDITDYNDRAYAMALLSNGEIMLSGGGDNSIGDVINNDMVSVRYTNSGIPSAVFMNGKEMPKNFTLEQNYPNPFNPGTAISYRLSAVSDVQLTVHNALGQKVSTLVNGRQKAGSHSVTFNAAGLASGVYFYRLRLGNGKVLSRKMILLQ